MKKVFLSLFVLTMVVSLYSVLSITASTESQAIYEIPNALKKRNGFFIITSEEKLLVLSTKDLVYIFTNSKKLSFDGKPLSVVRFSLQSQEHKAFVRSVLGMSDDQYRRKLSSEATYIQARSETDMLNLVSSVPGSIGYIAESGLPKEPKVKVIYIID